MPLGTRPPSPSTCFLAISLYSISQVKSLLKNLGIFQSKRARPPPPPPMVTVAPKSLKRSPCRLPNGSRLPPKWGELSFTAVFTPKQMLSFSTHGFCIIFVKSFENLILNCSFQIHFSIVNNFIDKSQSFFLFQTHTLEIRNKMKAKTTPWTVSPTVADTLPVTPRGSWA